MESNFTTISDGERDVTREVELEMEFWLQHKLEGTYPERINLEFKVGVDKNFPGLWIREICESLAKCGFERRHIEYLFNAKGFGWVVSDPMFHKECERGIADGDKYWEEPV